jgi:hypothetical protein
MRDFITNNWQTTTKVCRNAAEFIDALALSACAGYAIYESLHHHGLWYFGLKVAGLLIALQAFVLLVRHFNK